MNTIAKAKGQLYHHFHGTYWAQIGLLFESPEMAAAALPRLGAGWEIGKKDANVLVWSGKSEALQACKGVLGSFGADERKIDSIAKSIDRGELFTVAVPVEYTHPNQIPLAF